MRNFRRILFVISLLLIIYAANTVENPPAWVGYLNCVNIIVLLAQIPGLFFGGGEPEPDDSRPRFRARPAGRDRIIVETSEHPHSPTLRADLAHPVLGNREYTYDGTTTHMEIQVTGDPEVAAAVAEAHRTIRRNRDNSPLYRDAMAFLIYYDGNGDAARRQPGYPSLEKRRRFWAAERGE